MIENSRVFRVPEGSPPRRIDKIIAELAPDMGTRGSRRLVAAGHVLLNGRPAKPMQKASGGQSVELLIPETVSATGARLLSVSDNYCFFFKPRGIHSAPIKGKFTASFETTAAALMPNANLYFLQRLDFDTSGIICAAKNPEAAQAFRQFEKQNLCRKFYLAILRGDLKMPLTATSPIRPGFAKSAIAPGIAPPGRGTEIIPVHYWSDGEAFSEKFAAMPLTLAICIINRGQRHQIRVHAASLGHPLAGDPLYGSGEEYYLDHFRLVFPGESALSLGEGSLFSRLPEKAREALENQIKRPAKAGP